MRCWSSCSQKNCNAIASLCTVSVEAPQCTAGGLLVRVNVSDSRGRVCTCVVLVWCIYGAEDANPFEGERVNRLLTSNYVTSKKCTRCPTCICCCCVVRAAVRWLCVPLHCISGFVLRALLHQWCVCVCACMHACVRAQTVLPLTDVLALARVCLTVFGGNIQEN